MPARLATWLHRYLPAEAVALVAALLSAQVGWLVSGANPAVAALAGAWGETTAYYATMLLRDLRAGRDTPPAIVVRDLLLEFGVAEALDSLLVRPTLMYLATQLTSDLRLGVLVGKLASDVVFYIPTVIAFELRRHYLSARMSAS